MLASFWGHVGVIFQISDIFGHFFCGISDFSGFSYILVLWHAGCDFGGVNLINFRGFQNIFHHLGKNTVFVGFRVKTLSVAGSGEKIRPD